MATFRHVEQALQVYIPQGIAFTSDLPWFSGDTASPTAPTSATYTLRNAAGTAVISAQAATITNSVATYAIGSSVLDAETIGAHWQEEWRPTHGGVAYAPIIRRASLVRRELVCPVSTRTILDLHPGWTTYPSGQSSWAPQIERAWVWVQQQIERTGQRPYLVVGSDTLEECTAYKAAGLIARDLSTYVGDVERWERLADYYDRPATDDDPGGLAQRTWAGWRKAYDLDDDGQVQSDEAEALVYPAGRVW